MKTLVFYGAARTNGHTRKILNLALEHLEGEVEIIEAYKTTVKPCIDCRYCWKVKGCAIKDNMQEIYEKIENADNYIFASPMYFHTVPGPLKMIIDRMQVYWAGKLRNDRPKIRSKKGMIIMVGGAPSFDNQFNAGEQVLKGALGDLGANCVGIVNFSNSDRDEIDDFPQTKDEIKTIINKLNTRN